jgi:hypothetical protein
MVQLYISVQTMYTSEPQIRVLSFFHSRPWKTRSGYRQTIIVSMNLVAPVEQAGEHMFARLMAGTRCAKAFRHVGPGARQFARA